MEKICKNCRWYIIRSAKPDECVRRSPVLLPTGHTAYPTTGPRNDCGDFEPKEKKTESKHKSFAWALKLSLAESIVKKGHVSVTDLIRILEGDFEPTEEKLRRCDQCMYWEYKENTPNGVCKYGDFENYPQKIADIFYATQCDYFRAFWVGDDR